MDTQQEPPEIKDIPIRVLSQQTLKILSMDLNPLSDTLMPGSNRVADYRGLAELYGKGTQFILSLEDKRDPTGELLRSLSGKDATLSQLWENLRLLGRPDILRKCRELFREDTKRWYHRKPRDAFEAIVGDMKYIADILAEEIKYENRRSRIKAFFSTKKQETRYCEQTESAAKPGAVKGVGSVPSSRSPTSSALEPEPSGASRSVYSRSGHPANDQSRLSGQASGSIVNSPGAILAIDDIGDERPTYDAFIVCAEADISHAKEMLNKLEAPPYRLRLFLPDRQLMPGGSMFEDSAAVVEERCHGKVVIILTRHYVNSEACQFVTNFARALDPASQNKKIIPIIYERVDIPRMLMGLCFINKENDEKRCWFWRKLYAAIKQ